MNGSLPNEDTLTAHGWKLWGGYFFDLFNSNPITVNTIISISKAVIGNLLHQSAKRIRSTAPDIRRDVNTGKQPSTFHGAL